jgi:hypothetical protein
MIKKRYAKGHVKEQGSEAATDLPSAEPSSLALFLQVS